MNPQAKLAVEEIEKRAGKEYADTISAISSLAIITSVFDMDALGIQTIPQDGKLKLARSLDKIGQLLCRAASKTYNQSPDEIHKDLRAIGYGVVFGGQDNENNA